MTCPKYTEFIRASLKYLVFTIAIASLLWAPAASALSAAQKNLFQQGIYYFNAQADSCTVGSTIVLTGADNLSKVWNFLISRGLTPQQAAGVFGNLSWESGGLLDPKALEHNGEGVPGYTGHGIVQWSKDRWRTDYGPYEKNAESGIADAARQSDLDNFAPYPPRPPLDPKTLLGFATEKNTNWYDLGTQLEFMWSEIQPGGNRGTILERLKATTTLDESATLWFNDYESPGDSTLPNRISRGQEALALYGSSSTSVPTDGSDATPISSNGCASSATSPDCVTAVGRAKILCEAKKYDPISYVWGGGHSGARNWHDNCPTIGPDCGLDCSGLVNIAVYDVSGMDLNENTDGERADIGKYWQQISFGELQAGDLIQPHEGHVEIVDHVVGNTIYTFGAHTDSFPQEKQVGPASFIADSDDLYLRYIGSGV